MRTYVERHWISIVFTAGIVIFVVLYAYFDQGRNEQVNGAIGQTESALLDIGQFDNKISDADKRNLPPAGQMKGYGLRIFNWEGEFLEQKTIEYGNEPVKLMVSIINATDADDAVGFLLFSDGELTEFTVDGKEELNTVYQVQMVKNSMINIPISFVPSLSPQLASHRIDFALLYLLDEKPGDKFSAVPFYSMSSKFDLIAKSTDNIGDTKNLQEYTIPIQDGIEQWDGHGVKAVVELNEAFDSHNFFQKNELVVNKNQDAEFAVAAIGQEGTYSTYVFLDHRPIKLVNDQFNVVWSATANNMLFRRFKLDTTEISGEHQIYSLIVPMDAQYPKIIGSPKSILKVID